MFKVEVLIAFLGTQGFSARREGRYSRNRGIKAQTKCWTRGGAARQFFYNGKVGSGLTFLGGSTFVQQIRCSDRFIALLGIFPS